MTADDRRQALLDQLRYLIVEADALGPMLERLPVEVLTLRPLPDERSVLEAFAHLAALDRSVHLPRLQAMLEQDTPVFEPEEPASEASSDVQAVLAEMRAAREALAAAFEQAPPAAWLRTATFPDGQQRDLYAFALQITRHDAAVLRDLAYRLHESNLSSRPGPSAA